MPRRHASLTVLVSVLALAAGLTGSAASASAPAGPPARPGKAAPPDGSHQLFFTVTDSRYSAKDGLYRLECEPPGGDHPRAEAACAALLDASRGDRDPFRPVHPDENCTKIYGGSATAHIRGTWRGREVDAHFKRTDGCETARWDALVPALPKAGRED
ncbi:SSI family serine proteinase inhibitor [Streptomyces sp. HNM0574]|uniref:SSI family serine proteinase inhibitor n=1 Tax=Streptomyces sp. HNM0574 TaxID=2714954 RepID=UPI00146A5ADF|nr:SSI family serine proteinase inhibitor [Streptomyces sp. HNM0574]NLU67800.1 hypothetical protein [Streptomyces sp. HNM0574]